MKGDLASIRDTVDLAAQEVLDHALAFLIAQGYHTTERTDTSLTVERSDQSDGGESDRPHLTVLALPQPEGGVQVKVRGNDRDGMQERQSEWADWANGLPKRTPDQEITQEVQQEEADSPLPVPLPATKPAVTPREPVFNETVQLGIVVRDLECESPSSTKRCNWGSSYAIWRRRYEGTKTTMGSARGSSLRSTPVTRITTASTVGRVMWELIEPLDEEGIHARFLAEKGEGIHPSAGNGGFSEVWPGGAQRSSQSTCRTDRAELYPPDLTFGGCPSTRPAIP
jgi:hypothetical protein